jgi:hypothetical protein
MKSHCTGMRSWRLILALAFTTLCLASRMRAQSDTIPGPIFRAQNVPLKPGMEGVAVAADSATDVWVVGSASLHFDGTRWTQFPTGNPNVVLNSVVAISPSDVWAVGFFPNNKGFDTEVVRHFDGTAWSNVPDLNLVGTTLDGQTVLSESLVSITALSATDVWASGYLLTQQGLNQFLEPFVERFDGTKWRLSGALFGSGDEIMIGVNGISVISDSDAWIVAFRDFNGQDGLGEAFHFDGKRWTQVRTPGVGSSTLRAVAAVASDDVWAVGDQDDLQKTLIEHFDGKTWAVVPSPTPKDAQTVELWGVAAISATDIWASGFQRRLKAGTNRPLILHWDGSTWTIVPAPGHAGQSTTTFGIAVSAPGNVWIAGTFFGAVGQPILEPYVLFSSQGQ